MGRKSSTEWGERQIRENIPGTGSEATPHPLRASRSPPQHQLRDFDVVWVGDLEDLAVAEDVASAGGRGELDGRMPAGIGGVETGEDFAKAVGVRRLDEEVVVAVDGPVARGAERVGEVQRRLGDGIAPDNTAKIICTLLNNKSKS